MKKWGFDLLLRIFNKSLVFFFIMLSVLRKYSNIRHQAEHKVAYNN